MFKNLTYQQRLRYSGIAAILILTLCYQFSFSKTIFEYNSYRENQKNSSASFSDLNSIQLLKSKNNYLDGILSRFILDTIDKSRDLLAVTSNYCSENDLLLKEYRPGHPSQKDSLRMVTQSITVAGGFIECLKFVNFLETKSETGRIGSVQFKMNSSPGKPASELECTLFIQNIITPKNETK